MTPQQPIKLKAAVERMRQLTEVNIPFTIGFITYNKPQQTTKGYKVVEKVMLRPGYRKDQSKNSNILIGYIDTVNNKSRQFYLPLLLMFNGHPVTP